MYSYLLGPRSQFQINQFKVNVFGNSVKGQGSMAHTWLPSSPSVITATGMLAHGRGISNCRLSTKKKKGFWRAESGWRVLFLLVQQNCWCLKLKSGGAMFL